MMSIVGPAGRAWSSGTWTVAQRRRVSATPGQARQVRVAPLAGPAGATTMVRQATRTATTARIHTPGASTHIHLLRPR